METKKYKIIIAILGVLLIMATIIIPSKNIFSINDDKVIDNQKDKVESGATNVDIVRDYDHIVYSDNMTIGSSDYTKQTYHDQKVWSTTTLPPNDVEHYELLGYASMSLGYYAVIIDNIPKDTFDKRIEKIYSGVDKDNEANIKYTIHFDKIEFDITGDWHGSVSPSTSDTVDNFVKSNEKRTDYSGTILDENNTEDIGSEEFKLTDSTISYQFTRTSSFFGYPQTVTPKVEAPNAATIKYNNAIVDNGNSYSVHFSVLAYMQKYYLTYRLGGVDPDEFSLTRKTSGKGVEYLPKSIEITLYGETINLDLQDETITIGDGSNPISFDGNELMQTTNTPSLEETYGKVLEQYKDGKEIATIRCSIDDYYTDYYGDRKDKVIDIKSGSGTEREKSISFNVAETANEYGNIVGKQFVGFGQMQNLEYYTQASASVNCYYDELTGYINWSISAHPEEYIIMEITGTLLAKSMSFLLHDKVIPYIHTASGTDSPMSQYKDGTPKLFEVLSSKVYYDGAVWQELILQEYIQLATVQIGGVNVEFEGTAYMECFVIDGDIAVGDTLEYDGELGEITEKTSEDEQLHSLRCRVGGKFYNAQQQTITVRVRKATA